MIHEDWKMGNSYLQIFVEVNVETEKCFASSDTSERERGRGNDSIRLCRRNFILLIYACAPFVSMLYDSFHSFQSLNNLNQVLEGTFNVELMSKSLLFKFSNEVLSLKRQKIGKRLKSWGSVEEKQARGNRKIEQHNFNTNLFMLFCCVVVVHSVVDKSRSFCL